MTAAYREWPVIVVGAGPTGLTLACLLARYGVEVLVIEREETTVQEPRAVSIDDEALRTMQAAGMGESILPDIVLGYGSHYYSPLGKCFLKVQPKTREYGYPRRNAFRQPLLQDKLRQRLAHHPRAELWFNSEVIGVEQTSDKVVLRVQRAGGLVDEVSCSYLVACDGSKSFVRRTLGIDMTGSTFRERWLIIDLAQTKDPGRDTKVFCHPARPAISLPGPHGTRRFEFMLHKGETEERALDPENIARWLRLYGNDDKSPIVRKTVYTFHARVAERWKAGRVLLGGDAAHLTPPFAGQGMNSGIRDAHNLAWKLAFVLQGRLGSKLLDTYEPERRPHAWEMIQLAVRMGYIMMPRNWVWAIGMDFGFRLLGLVPPARDYFAEMKYKPKPQFKKGFLVRNGGGDGPGEQMVGRLFPQLSIASGSGEVLLDELLGDGFALVGPPGMAMDALPGELLKTLGIERNVELETLRGVSGLLLLRPDRYVAAYLPAGKLEQAARDVEKLIAAYT